MPASSGWYTAVVFGGSSMIMTCGCEMELLQPRLSNQVDMVRGARLNRRHEHLFEPALEDRSVSPSRLLREVRQRARVALALEAHRLSYLANHRDRLLVGTRRVAAESQGDSVLPLHRLRATCSAAVLRGHV